MGCLRAELTLANQVGRQALQSLATMQTENVQLRAENAAMKQRLVDNG
jgi:hypothetical protein